MERDESCILEYNSIPNAQLGDKDSVLSLNLFLDYVGEVVLTLSSDGLSWNLVESTYKDESSCFGIKLVTKTESEIRFSDIYAVEFINWGLIHESILSNAGGCLLGHASEMYRFTVHGFQRSRPNPSVWAPSMHTFGHKDLQTCQMWVDRINASLNIDTGRPKNLLVFVNPKSGKGNGLKTWEAVAPIFSLAKVKTKVTMTKKAGQAFDVISSMTSKDLSSYDGVLAVGGDGFFNEILNGILLSRHKAPYPPSPTDFKHSVEYDDKNIVNTADGTVAEPSDNSEAHSPLLSSGTDAEPSDSNEAHCPLLSSECNGPQVTNFRFAGTKGDSCSSDQYPEFPIPNKKFRFGIIPAGSTDATVICTTGTRDPMTSTLHIILGKKVSLDVAQVVRWKRTSTSDDEPYVRYAASFAGYGFYGDVITESEKYRWMGPKRYDYAGTMVFLSHRSYEAEIAYLEVKSKNANAAPGAGPELNRKRPIWGGRVKKPERVVCRANCNICNTPHTSISSGSQESRWLRLKGHYLSVGAAVISCRNDKAPDGLVADAHLSDGFIHLVLIKDCPRAFYLWHLTQLARKGGQPLDYEFVEHYKTTAFTFTSHGKQSMWNVDGELMEAHKLSAQVFRGLVNLFATGPEV